MLVLFYIGDRVYTPDVGDEYEILNYASNNYLTFTRNGIYLFEIIVVDHDYRYAHGMTLL